MAKFKSDDFIEHRDSGNKYRVRSVDTVGNNYEVILLGVNRRCIKSITIVDEKYKLTYKTRKNSLYTGIGHPNTSIFKDIIKVKENNNNNNKDFIIGEMVLAQSVALNKYFVAIIVGIDRVLGRKTEYKVSPVPGSGYPHDQEFYSVNLKKFSSVKVEVINPAMDYIIQNGF